MVACALGGLVLALAWGNQANPLRLDSTQTAVMALLIASAILAARFPIHLRNQAKVMIITVPLYLIAALLPPPIAALAAGVAILGVALILRPQTNNLPSDIATAVGRWIVVAWLASLVAHSISGNPVVQVSTLVLAAVTMFVGDIIGTAFEVGAISGEPPARLIFVLLHDLVSVESAQYGLGIVGVLIAKEQPLALLILVVPTIILYLAFTRAKELRESTRTLLEGMADTIDLRDPYTGGHSRRVADLCRDILSNLAVQGPEVELIFAAARVHDIGKISIPDEILSKPGKLTPEETAIMQTHSQVGADLLAQYADFARGKEIVLHHHEQWDGKGYPAGLKSAAIPFGARVIAVADSFDAMTNDRPYRKAMTVDRALQILTEGRGAQWDARVVDAFVATVRAKAPTPTTPVRRETTGASLQTT